MRSKNGLNSDILQEVLAEIAAIYCGDSVKYHDSDSSAYIHDLDTNPLKVANFFANKE